MRSSGESTAVPDEVLLAIFSHLARHDVRALCQATAVCKRWYGVGQDNALWSVVVAGFFGSHHAATAEGNTQAQRELRRWFLSCGQKLYTLRTVFDGHVDGAKQHCATLPPPKPAALKACLVGDQGTGKTCWAITHSTNAFPTGYVPCVFDNYSPGVMVSDDQRYSPSLWDTAGSDFFNGLRPLCYQGVDVFVLFFSLVDRASYDQIARTWMEEIRPYLTSETRVILVGTKLDLLRDLAHQPLKDLLSRTSCYDVITFSQAWRLAYEVGAVGFVPISALAGINMPLLFDLIRAAPNMSALTQPEAKATKSKGKGKPACLLS